MASDDLDSTWITVLRTLIDQRSAIRALTAMSFRLLESFRMFRLGPLITLEALFAIVVVGTCESLCRNSRNFTNSAEIYRVLKFVVGTSPPLLLLVQGDNNLYPEVSVFTGLSWESKHTIVASLYFSSSSRTNVSPHLNFFQNSVARPYLD